MNPILKKVRIIPRLDVKGENLVKGVHLEGLRVLGSPAQFAAEYYKSGADEIIFMDSVASLYGRNHLRHIVESVAQEIFIPMTVGGGIRSLDDVTKLLRSGADKVAINTALFKNPEIVAQVADHFGSQCMVVSIDVMKENGEYECLVDNGRERTNIELFNWIEKVIKLGAGEILLTSVDKEGTGNGYDIELTKSVSTRFDVPIITCGGAGNREHILDVCIKGNADAVAISSVLHYDTVNIIPQHNLSNGVNSRHFVDNNKNILRKGISEASVGSVKEYLIENGVHVRTQRNIHLN
jgi:cyclase